MDALKANLAKLAPEAPGLPTTDNKSSQEVITELKVLRNSDGLSPQIKTMLDSALAQLDIPSAIDQLIQNSDGLPSYDPGFDPDISDDLYFPISANLDATSFDGQDLDAVSDTLEENKNALVELLEILTPDEDAKQRILEQIKLVESTQSLITERISAQRSLSHYLLVLQVQIKLQILVRCMAKHQTP